MSISAYEIVQHVVEQKSFNRAAEIVNLTPGAVSRSISGLESLLGFPLFVRRKRGVELTQEGEILYPYICDILRREETLRQKVAEIQGLAIGSVRIAALGSVCIAWLPQIIRSFNRVYPHIHVMISEAESSDIVRSVRDSFADIGFVALPGGEGLCEIPLYEDPLYCVTPQNYFPKEKHFVTVEDLAQMTFLTPQNGRDISVILDLLEEKDSCPYSIPVMGDNATLAMVECGMGSSIIPGLFLGNRTVRAGVYPIVPGHYRTIGLITTSREKLSPATHRMVQHIISQMKERGLLHLHKQVPEWMSLQSD